MRKREIVINVSQTRRIFTILSTDVVSIYIYIQIYFIWLWQSKIQLKTNKKVGLNNATCGGSSSLSCKRTSFFECDPTTSTCQCKAPYLWDATLTSQTCSKCIDNYFASSGASCRFVFWTFLHFFPILFYLVFKLFKKHKVGLNNASCSLPSKPCKDTPNFACSSAGTCHCNWPNVWNPAFATCDSCAPNYVLIGHTCCKYFWTFSLSNNNNNNNKTLFKLALLMPHAQRRFNANL